MIGQNPDNAVGALSKQDGRFFIPAACSHIVTRMFPRGLRGDRTGTSQMSAKSLDAVETISIADDCFDIRCGWSAGNVVVMVVVVVRSLREL